jgi:hypothetical protein
MAALAHPKIRHRTYTSLPTADGFVVIIANIAIRRERRKCLFAKSSRPRSCDCRERRVDRFPHQSKAFDVAGSN